MRLSKIWPLIIATLLLTAFSPLTVDDPAKDPRVRAMHEQTVFADIHAHPSAFHRNNVEEITAEEIDVYKRNMFDLVVASISSDMAYSGGYVNRDGSKVKKGQHKPKPGQIYALSVDRLERLKATFKHKIAVHADTPASVHKARANNQVAIMPALEGGDALEGDIENLYEFHKKWSKAHSAYSLSQQ